MPAATVEEGGENATKPCPKCAEPIKAAAKKCKHCGAMLDGSSQEPEEPGGVPCPFCAELIKAAAIKCKHCNSLLSPEPSGAFGGFPGGSPITTIGGSPGAGPPGEPSAGLDDGHGLKLTHEPPCRHCWKKGKIVHLTQYIGTRTSPLGRALCALFCIAALLVAVATDSMIAITIAVLGVVALFLIKQKVRTIQCSECGAMRGTPQPITSDQRHAA